MAYTYENQLWKDYPDTTTPITADRLNHMEDGIKGLSDAQVSIEVVDSLDGNSTTNPPSQRAVNEALLDTYSTEEQRIGTLFGKPLYRKYLNFNLATSTIYNSISHNISDIDYIIKVEGSAYDGHEFYIMPAALPSDNVAKYGLAIQSITKTNVHIYSGTENKANNINVKMFVYYTKTTD